MVREPLRSYYSLAAAGQRGAGLAGGAAGKAGPGEAEADVGAAELQAAVDGDADAGQDLKDVQDILEVGPTPIRASGLGLSLRPECGDTGTGS